MEDDNWLNSKAITCTSCNEKLEVMENSPFSDGFYLYCSDCRNRIDISIYDSEYEKIENELKVNGIKPENEDYLNHLYKLVTSKVEKCDCGGKFNYHSKRRCIYCGEVVQEAESHCDIWYYSDDDTTDEEVDKGEEQMAKFTLKPKWLKK